MKHRYMVRVAQTTIFNVEVFSPNENAAIKGAIQYIDTLPTHGGKTIEPVVFVVMSEPTPKTAPDFKT